MPDLPAAQAEARASQYCTCGHRYDWHQYGLPMAWDPTVTFDGDVRPWPGYCYGCSDIGLWASRLCVTFELSTDQIPALLDQIVGDGGHGNRS